MSAQHTKGQWERGKLDDEGYAIYSGPTDDAQHLAQVLDAQEDGESLNDETLGNANIIAAAPDLLAACELALAELTEWNEGHEQSEAQIDLRAAIAKAKG